MSSISCDSSANIVTTLASGSIAIAEVREIFIADDTYCSNYAVYNWCC